MSSIRYENRNGKTYAYTSTSKRVPGRKNPVSVKRYLGVVDPETGEIHEKVARVPPRELPPDGARMVNYGDALLAFTVAERLGIREDLEGVFGKDADRILALALAQAIRPTPSDSIDLVLNSSCIPYLLGLDARIGSADVRGIVNSIDLDRMFAFFRRRWSMHSGKLYAYAHQTIDSDDIIQARERRDPATEVSILIIMTEDGTPIAFSPVGDISRDTSELVEAMQSIRKTSDCVFIADTAISPTLDLTGLIDGDVDFAIPYAADSDQFRAVQSDYRDVESPCFRKEHSGREYYLQEGVVGLLQGTGGQILVPQTDPRFGDAVMGLISFLCYDPRMRAEEVVALRDALSDIEFRLEGKVFEYPAEAFEKVAGRFERFLRYVIDEDGTMSLIRRRGRISEFRTDAGKTFVVLRSAEWDDVVSGRVARTAISRAIAQFNGGSRQLKRYICKGVRTEPHLFIEFIAITIYSEIQRTLDAAGMKDVDVSRAFLMASTYKATITVNGLIRGSRDRRVPRLFEALGVSDDFDVVARVERSGIPSLLPVPSKYGPLCSPVLGEHQRRHAAPVHVLGDAELLQGELDLPEFYSPDVGHLPHLPGEVLPQGLRRSVDVPLGHVSALAVLSEGVGDPGCDHLPLGPSHLREHAVRDSPHGHLADLDALSVDGDDRRH